MSPVRPTLQVVGRRLDPEHYELRDFLTRIAQPHEWYEAGSQEGDELLSVRGLVDPPMPVVVDGDDVVTAAPTPAKPAPTTAIERGRLPFMPGGELTTGRLRSPRTLCPCLSA